ncbi:MAG: KEOPS complex subunit Cgi121 [Canidatus Methanoxibalbensis ujae]|nr:KEOPS complex subunit Cgi121 [Candidatus Methanoxibalbensis ujae]MCW7078890.1 KEOPS complex subunit Cgi121 [Candidatus Methanoxibalbensis ujae]
MRLSGDCQGAQTTIEVERKWNDDGKRWQLEMETVIIIGRADVHSVDDFIAVLRDIASGADVHIQAFDAKKVASEAHILSAVHKAIRAFRKKRNISPDLSMEILLYAAGERQIHRALEMGISDGKNRKIAIVIVDPRGTRRLKTVAEEVKKRLKIREEGLGDLSERAETLKNFFHITDEELNAVGEEKLEKLVLERVALLDVKK